MFIIAYSICEWLWLSNTVGIYAKNAQTIMGGSKIRPTFGLPGVAAYVVLYTAVYYFVIKPINNKSAWLQDIFVPSTLLALAIYGVYNWTSMTLFPMYSKKIAIIDIAWGVFAVNLVAFIVYMCVKTRLVS